MKHHNLVYLAQAAECLKVLAHPKRLEIITILRDHESLSVGEIAERCELLQHVTSEHLRLMQRCGFLSSRREGKFCFYQIQETHVLEILDCIETKFKKKGKVKNAK